MARYAEYLLGEKKWKTAQNMSSLNTQVGLIGRKSHRKRSAISYLTVTHTDPEGVERLENLGKTFFNLNDESNYDNISRDSDPQQITKTKSLTPWTFDRPYVIPKYTRFVSASGVEFVSTEAVASRTLQEPYSLIQSDVDKYNVFIGNKGWEGIKYVKVPTIQGKIVKLTLGVAAGQRFETLVLEDTNCEDASNTVSKDLLKIYVNPTPDVDANKVEWNTITNILLAGPHDNVVEIINKVDYSGVLFKFGDGITGSKLPAGSTISIQYLKTDGEAGNVTKPHQIKSIVFPEGYNMVDPRTESTSNFLSVTNTSPILGGKDEEDEDDLRAQAPLDYMQYYAIATTASYEAQIKNTAQIGLDKVKVFGGTKEDVVALGFDDLAESNKAVLYVTAISSNGEKIEDPENNFIKPVVKAIGDLKAPDDTLAYIEPSFIKLRLGATVYSDSSDLSDEDIIKLEKQSLIDNYDIFNRTFKQAFHTSDMISLTKAFPFVEYVSTHVEALAEVNINTDDVKHIQGITRTIYVEGVSTEVTYPTMYKFSFKFNDIYGSNPYAYGFKNYLQNAPMVLRIDLEFKNNPSKAAKLNRTFFMYDNRNVYEGNTIPSIKQAKLLNVDESNCLMAGLSDWTRPNEIADTYPDRAVRTAQFPYISDITDDPYMLGSVKSQGRAPYEIRPYIQDSLGANRIYNVEDVSWPSNEEDPRVFLPGNNQCNVIDSRFIDYFDIEYSENYDAAGDAEYATGFVTIPAKYFSFTNIDIDDPDQFIGAANNFVSIKVTAQPLLADITPTAWNDIIFCEEEDIVVKRKRP